MKTASNIYVPITHMNWSSLFTNGKNNKTLKRRLKADMNKHMSKTRRRKRGKSNKRYSKRSR